MLKPGILFVFLVGPPALQSQEDPYERYVKTSEDFRRVKQDKAFAAKAWPGWTYIPWYHQWRIGFGEEGGRFSVDHGYNGALVDGASPGDIPGFPKADRLPEELRKGMRLDWIARHRLRFYMDHAAGKGELHLWDGNQIRDLERKLISGTGFRPKPLNAEMKANLERLIRLNVGAVKASPFRSAYALDDEPSWGHFVLPCMWQATDEKDAYRRWLAEIYGPKNVPERSAWVSYDDLRGRLRDWTIATFDAGPLLDQWTFNDSWYLNFLGDLVEQANRIDPETPAGIVGGQSPNAFGGYDYAKLMRKIQFIEAYNIGSSQAVIRSFNPRNALPAVTAHFYKSAEDSVWGVWYYLAHGNRGHIGWVDRPWFDGAKPAAWHAIVASHNLEAGRKIGPLMTGAEWMHDGVALYYSHPSIQLGWILDAEPHGASWPRRYNDHRLGASHRVRLAWENMLRDEGLQYSFLSYADVIEKGVPPEYRVLILPACLCLSDAEARRIREFCRAGGTVIADYLPGLWDQHGKGRPGGGVLDDLFGVKHDPGLGAKDLFGGKLWCEVDQDATFEAKSFQESLSAPNGCLRDESGFNKAVRRMQVGTVHAFGKGKAVLLNLSPQGYLAFRDAGREEARRRRETFMRRVRNAGPGRWVDLKDAGDREHGYEITYWSQGDRIILFVCFNPEIVGTGEGEGHAKALKTRTVPITLAFEREVRDLRDERAGKTLGDGTRFPLAWTMNEAIVVSFRR